MAYNRTEQEIINRREYERNWYRNLPEEIKNKRREYQKKKRKEYQQNKCNTIIKAN